MVNEDEGLERRVQLLICVAVADLLLMIPMLIAAISHLILILILIGYCFVLKVPFLNAFSHLTILT